ncbi:MAG: hypothetical protein C0497_10445 [Gemmatimonas sp.]|nr:hypothetical protein [Gemmatimonas sp.]
MGILRGGGFAARPDSAWPSVYHLPSTLYHQPLSNPLSLVPFALAAGGGRVDDLPAAGAVAAGFTLLQRSTPLVRALAGRRSAILLPPGVPCLTALAASDGRGAVLLPPGARPGQIAAQLDDADVGAVFTTRGLATLLPAGDRAVVLLDDAPRSATVMARGAETVVDLGSHFGLDLEGEEDAGSDEECLITYAAAEGQPVGAVFTHRNLLALARGAVDATSILKGDHVLACTPPSDLAAFALTFAGPLLAGARVTSMPESDADQALRLVERGEVTMLCGNAEFFASITSALEARGTPLAVPTLRVTVCLGEMAAAALHERWHQWTGTELRQAFGIPEAPLCLFNAPHFANRRGTLGIPFPGVHVAVRDAVSGAPVARGTAGKLWVRGDPTCSSYVGRTAGQYAARDEWLPTHRLARERADGAYEPAD